MKAEEIKAKAHWFAEELNKGNADAGDQVYADDFILHRTPLPDIVSLRRWKRFYTYLLTGMPDLKLAIDELIVEGDNKLVTRITWQGTHTAQSKAFPWPPTGKKAVWTSCDVYHFKGDKIVEAWQHVDNLAMMQQLGVIPSM